MTKAAGIWPCAVLGASFGKDDKGLPQVQINVRIEDGPDKGQCCTYEDQVNNKSALYVGRSCTAIGWKGRDLSTLKADVAAWIAKTDGMSSVEIRHVEIKKGNQFNKWIAGGSKGPAPIWDKVNSIGRGPRVLKEATGEILDDANEAMRAAMEAEGAHDEPPPEDDDGSWGPPSTRDGQHAADSDIPF